MTDDVTANEVISGLARELAALDGHTGEHAFFEYPLTDQNRNQYRKKARAILAGDTVRELQAQVLEEAAGVLERNADEFTSGGAPSLGKATRDAASELRDRAATIRVPSEMEE